MDNEILNEMNHRSSPNRSSRKAAPNAQQHQETDEDDNFPAAKMIKEQDSNYSNYSPRAHNQLKPITCRLTVKVWTWDKDHGHKLFNFHEGYQVNNSIPPILGSSK